MAASERNLVNDPESAWERLLESQADGIREKVPEHDSQTPEETNFEELDIDEDEFQEWNMMGSEAENIGERDTGRVPRSLDRDFTIRHMNNIADNDAAAGVNYINLAASDEIASVDLEFENGFTSVSDVDVEASEKEEVTGLVRTVDDMIRNLEMVEQISVDENPDEDVHFKRQGHLTEMIIRGSGGAHDWDKADNGKYAGPEKISGPPRYFDFDLSFPGVLQVGGTGSVQTTMRPKIYEEHEGDPDSWIRDFSGGGDRIGMHALSPLIYGPFQSSPVITEVETEDGTEKAIEVLNGRDKAYGQGFQSEHDLKGYGKTIEEYITENSKAAYSPELEEIDNMEDAVDFPATSAWTFSDAIEAGKMKVVDEGETYDAEEDYATLDEVAEIDISPEDAGHVRVGHEDWENGEEGITISMKEFLEHEMFEGTVHFVDEEGNRKRKRVVVDYRDNEMFPGIQSEDDMIDVARGHYQADSTAVWEPFRMRPDKPAFEYRDMCNNPFRDAGIATQVGAFRRWREIQEFAEQDLGITSVEDAQQLRLGVNGMLAEPGEEDYQDKIGLDYTVNEEYGITLQDAWTGNHDRLETGMIDIIADGLEAEDIDGELVTGEAYSVDEYRETMTELAENGLTPGEMMAKDYGVEMEGDILYDEEDLFVGGKDGEHAA